VVPRKPKLIAAAAVLAVGLGLAWPWRRSETMPTAVLPIATPSTSFRKPFRLRPLHLIQFQRRQLERAECPSHPLSRPLEDCRERR
jgi:hypothetical protein